MHRILAFGRCFADPVCLRVVVRLLEEPLTIREIQEALNLGRHIVDARLMTIREADLVREEQDGRWIRYHLHDDARKLISRVIRGFYDDVSWDAAVQNDARRRSQIRGGPPTPGDLAIINARTEE